MNIARITERVVKLRGGTEMLERVVTIGADQGFLALPVRVGVDQETGYHTMTSAWEPTPAELAALNAGATVHVELLGTGMHPPIKVRVGPTPMVDEVEQDRGASHA